MNYGLYLSASGVLTNLYRQDVYANNLANAQTVGFKPDVPALSYRPVEAVEDDLGFELSHDLLDRLGGGVFAGDQRIKFTQSNLEMTGRDLDVALVEPKQFFVVSAIDAATNQSSIMLTRDGRFAVNESGELVTATQGHHVLDRNDAPIQLGPGPVRVDSTGRIFQDGQIVAQLQVSQVNDTNGLVKHGQSLFRMAGDNMTRQVVQGAAVKSRFVENSGTDPIMALMKLIDSTKSATGNATMIRYHDLLMEQAVNVLGRVSA